MPPKPLPVDACSYALPRKQRSLPVDTTVLAAVIALLVLVVAGELALSIALF